LTNKPLRKAFHAVGTLHTARGVLRAVSTLNSSEMPEFHLHHTPTHEQFFSSVLPVVQFIGIIGRRTGMQSFKASNLVTVRYRNGLPESASHLDVLARNCPHLLPT
jgi:hypothetical protein